MPTGSWLQRHPRLMTSNGRPTARRRRYSARRKRPRRKRPRLRPLSSDTRTAPSTSRNDDMATTTDQGDFDPRGRVMTEHVCDVCGTPNAIDARFCVSCDERLGWPTSQKPPDPAPKPPERIDSPISPEPSGSPALAPEVEIPQPEAILEPDAGVGVQVRNPSTIVDAYQMTLIAAPRWLTLSHPEVTLMPGATELITATFAMAPGELIPAQTITVGLRVCS